MKGMFLKEFYQLKDNIPVFILTIVFFAVVYSFFNVPFLELVIVFIMFITASTTFFKQEMLNNENNFNRYLKTLPINFNKIIIAKYLFMLFIAVLLLFISIVCSLFIKEEMEILYQIKYYLGYIFLFNFCFIYFPISYLIFLFLKSNLIASLISNLVGICISMAINSLLIALMISLISNIFRVDINSSLFPKNIFLIAGLISTFILAIIVYIIYKITCLKYRKISE